MDNQEIEQAIKEKGMTFGLAIEELKAGKKVARAGWNGKGMWLSLVVSIHDIQREGTTLPVYRLTIDDAGTGATALPWIGMKTADNKFVPWLASQTDMLAEDWAVVECDTALAPHQQRVVAEKAELDAKLEKLSAFISSDGFSTIVADDEERGRLICQEEVMKQYSEILGERIAAFKKTD